MPHPMLNRRTWLAQATAAAGMSALPGWARGKAYPTRSIRLIVPFAAGGSTDIVARLLADAMQRIMGESIVVDNKPGAGGMIGAEALARSMPDGYTMGLGSISTLAVNPVVLKASRVDPLTELQPVIPLASIASVFSVPSSLGIENFTQFLQAARAQRDNWAAGSSGVGSVGHLILEAFNADLQLKLRHIPFKGMGPVINSTLAGQTQVLSDQFPSSAPHIRAGRLKPFAVAAKTRLAELPQVPTLAELGYPQLNDLAITWFGLVVPQGVPMEVVHQLNQVAQQALQQDALKALFASMGVTPLGGTPEDLQRMVVDTTAHVRALVAERGISDGS